MMHLLVDLYDYVNRPRRNILEVLYDFRHTTPNIAFNYLFDLLPPVRPRSFSIASAPSVHGGKVQLLVAVVSFRTQLVKQRLGLCSSFLASCNVGDKVPIWVKKGTFSFPLEEQSPQKPMIMVGPGTGIAPFRSFALERLHLDRNNGGKSDLVVFFGCRNRRGDYYFADEWENMKASEEVDNGFKFFAAFSRDQEDKEYVQHLIEKKADLVREFVQERGGSVYIAGNAKMMPDQVMDEIKKSLAGLEENENEKYVEEMVAKKRLQMETWS
jgi:sulfite reductase alpha subunit-like flavoprotein